VTTSPGDDAVPKGGRGGARARSGLELVPETPEEIGFERDHRRERRDPSVRIEGILERAARDRRRAAADRAQASDDRARAAVDRQEAARERSEALALRAEAASSLELAATDGLTGVWTRTFGLEVAAREIDRAQRTGQRVVIVFIDVDGLKRVNDRDGHQAGDRLLRAVGETLRAGLRPYDVIVRFGGDEFLAVLLDIGPAEARMRFAQIAVTLAAGKADRTFSLGLATAGPGETLEVLIARADAELLATRRRARDAD
jgi:diguanylate cyclase (GGDEF)-like protein